MLQVIQQYLGYTEVSRHVTRNVPVTLKHFKMLARLGKAPVSFLHSHP